MPDNVLIIYILIVIFVLLEGCSNASVYKYHNQNMITDKYPDISMYTSQNKKINMTYNQQKKVINNVHKYNYIDRGSYRRSIYIVQSGDTLFYIAWITGNNYLDLVKINDIKNVNMLQVGQVLKVHPHSRFIFLKKNVIKFFTPFNMSNNFFKEIFFFIRKPFSSKMDKNIRSDLNISCYEIIDHSKIPELVVSRKWHWPTNGTIINTFSDSERGNKGIDISGVLGQPVVAAANGKVVYIGNTLKGYGNLIVIKHDNNYLSAYAHNDIILVTEQQNVRIGDKIATMGCSGSNEVKLHFEIRYKGKSIDPLHFLQR